MKLDLATRTLFADFQETVRTRTALESKIVDATVYVRKKVKGKVYWYEQRYEGGKARQKYFGPSDEKNDSHVASVRGALRSDKSMLKKLASVEARQAAMLRRSGLPSLDRRLALLLSRFSKVGLIYRSGVLVGTLAYQSYAGMLGSVFEKASLMTQDIDIARDDQHEVIPAIVNFETLFSERGLHCTAIPSLSRKALPSSYVTEDGIRIDLLVPLRGQAKGSVTMPRTIGAGATALRFLDYLIEDPVEALLVAPDGGIPITVPRPERFAIHKLIVAAYRPVTESAKRLKDLYQAGQLIAVLSEERKRELRGAMRKALSTGRKWEKAIKASRTSLPPEIQLLIK